MTVFRWIVGILGALLAVAALFGLGLSVALESRVWNDRAKSFRHALWLVVLLWFNVEVWGRVIYTIVHWK